jgi:hypothetical protein
VTGHGENVSVEKSCPCILLVFDIDLFLLAHLFVDLLFFFPADLLFVFDVDLLLMSVDDCL